MGRLIQEGQKNGEIRKQRDSLKVGPVIPDGNNGKDFFWQLPSGIARKTISKTFYVRHHSKGVDGIPADSQNPVNKYESARARLLNEGEPLNLSNVLAKRRTSTHRGVVGAILANLSEGDFATIHRNKCYTN